MHIDVISIGYDPELIIAENNVINLKETFTRPRSPRGFPPILSCFTTRGYENPIWMISSNQFSTGPLMNDEAIPLGNGSVIITINRVSIYHSQIYINATDVEFTGNLTCQSQNNSKVQYTVIITTGG